MKTSEVILTILFFTLSLYAQKSETEWEPVFTEGSDKVYVDVSGLKSFHSDDIYVWTLTVHSTPIVIESVKDKIYKTNTYYLFNSKLNKYSMLHIIYYDKNGNVLASYDYGRNTNVQAYQYNYPVLKGSPEYAILQKCLDVIKSKDDSSN
jgi:hypothetical protein